MYIQRVPMARFLEAGSPVIVSYTQCYPPGVVINRAKSLLGKRGYNAVFNNCEHFARLCKTGHGKSQQVRQVAALCMGAVISVIAMVTDFNSTAAMSIVGYGIYLFSRFRA